jgi:hypothetical protein
MVEIDVPKIIQDIEQLQRLRLELLEQELSPEQAWIHQYEVKRVYPSGNTEWYCYAKWQAHQAIFRRNPKHKHRIADKEPGFTKHQHIGRVSSSTGLGMEPEVKEAYRAWHDRQRLEAIEESLLEIHAVLARASES